MAEHKNVVDFIASSANQAHCQTCTLNSLCLPIALDSDDMDVLDKAIKRGRPIQKGDFLFKQGEPFTAVYAIRTGAVKTYTIAPGGDEQITGFHLSSELVGLAGYSENTYPLTAKVLETTTVCELPLEKLESLCDELPGLRKQLMRTMGSEIRQDQQMILQLSKKTADERLAYFLIDLASRFERRGYSSKVFRLSMSRMDIGNYLGLAVETVSRVFTRFQKNGLIETEGKEVILLDRNALLEMSGENNHAAEGCSQSKTTK